VRALQISLGETPKQAHAGTFTALRSGNESLIHAIANRLPAGCLQLNHPVTKISHQHGKWHLRCDGNSIEFDALLLATPAHVAAKLLADVDERLSQLHFVKATSGTLAALLFERPIDLPPGFGFLVNQPQAGFHPAFLACTFSHQKYPHCAPAGAALLRVFFGGTDAAHVDQLNDAAIGRLATEELRKLFPSLPAPAMTMVQRWPQSLPQYEVGHEARVAEIEQRAHKFPGLFLLGNAYRGVGLPDMVALAQLRARLAIAN
jgi:oxygen-dependent protoporphyrinogen oxidase